MPLVAQTQDQYKVLDIKTLKKPKSQEVLAAT